MAVNDAMVEISLVAGQDLSANQFHFVSVAADGQIDPTGDGLAADGILTNKPDAAGKAATVAIPNGARVKVECGGTVTAGGEVASNATGEAVDAASGDIILGTALEGGADGEIISILFNVRGAAG